MPINDRYDEPAVIRATAQALEDFYTNLTKNLGGLDLSYVLRRKNPYLFRAKAMNGAAEIVEALLSAYVSSSEETIFGNVFFEPIALAASGGVKAVAEGVDITIERGDTIFAIAVKSGTSVFNADSRKRQETNFMAAYRVAQQGRRRLDALIGYGYGRKRQSERAAPRMYTELAGQAFWTELTGDPEFYLKLIRYMGDLPEQYRDRFDRELANAANRLVREFSSHFCRTDGSIDWELLVEYNSGSYN